MSIRRHQEIEAGRRRVMADEEALGHRLMWARDVSYDRLPNFYCGRVFMAARPTMDHEQACVFAFVIEMENLFAFDLWQ